jgi:FdhE protein
MTPAQTGPDYDARIRRAQYLADNHAFAKEILIFYARLAEFHRRLYSQLHQSSQPSPASGMGPVGLFCAPLDFATLIPLFPDFLLLLQRAGPRPISDAAGQVSQQGPSAWTALFSSYWSAAAAPDASARDRVPDSDAASQIITEFVLRAFLQPYAEFLASRCAEPPLLNPPSCCPLCGSRPLLGVLRPEGDGGKRDLLCSLCLHEWTFRRIFCPACNEESEPKLPIFVAEQFPHVRVEACDTCRFYIRSIDLTKDGHAVPLVDDLAAIPLTLWADEHNYSRLRSNLLST